MTRASLASSTGTESPPTSKTSPHRFAYFTTAAIPSSIMCLLLVSSIWWFGSFDALLAASAGHSLFVPTPNLVIENLAPSETRHIDVPVQNLTSSDVTIIGSHSSCGCSVVSNLPLIIPPWSTASVSVVLTAPEAGTTEAAITLYTTNANQQLHVRLVGHVVAHFHPTTL